MPGEQGNQVAGLSPLALQKDIIQDRRASESASGGDGGSEDAGSGAPRDGARSGSCSGFGPSEGGLGADTATSGIDGSVSRRSSRSGDLSDPSGASEPDPTGSGAEDRDREDHGSGSDSDSGRESGSLERRDHVGEDGGAEGDALGESLGGSTAASVSVALRMEADEEIAGAALDRWGFWVIEPDSLTEVERRERLGVDARQRRLENLRLEKWRNMLGPGCSRWAIVVQKHKKKLKSRIRKGIPEALRGQMWMLFSCAQEAKEDNMGLFRELAATEHVQMESTIERDITRTFPLHKMFRHEEAGGQDALRSVLRAYSAFCPEVGYCQGMAFLGALLLSYLPAEDAFWVLVALMHDYGMEGLYRPGLPRFQLLTYQFQALFKKRMPKLAAHMEAEGVHTSMYASQWFITCFAYSFPFAVVTRVWDIFFSEGWKIIFRVALAILKLGQKELLTLPFEDMLPHIKKIPSMHSADEIISTAIKIDLKTKTLWELEEAYCKEFGTVSALEPLKDMSGRSIPTGGDLRGSASDRAASTAKSSAKRSSRVLRRRSSLGAAPLKS